MLYLLHKWLLRRPEWLHCLHVCRFCKFRFDCDIKADFKAWKEQTHGTHKRLHVKNSKQDSIR